MKLLFVRHAEPDYEIDSITERGWKEAECLCERLSRLDVKAFYVSPLGRALDTASLTLKKMNREAQVCPWLEEFPPKIRRPDKKGEETIIWDWLPQDFVREKVFYDKDLWAESSFLKEGNVREKYNSVIAEFDKLIEKHGYKREGNLYKALQPNNDTLVFFCHFGLESVLLGHLLDISPMMLLQHTCALPSSVTTVVTEERRRGIAQFRMCGFGDISHLYANGIEPSFAARFCECYDNEDELHD